MLGSFNIRKLGKARGRERELDFMACFCAACDLVAIQEAQDDWEGLRHLQHRTESRVAGVGEYALAISDITGEAPGESGIAERLAFLYRHRRIRRLELAADLTFDRTAVLLRFFDHRRAWLDAHRTYERKLEAFRAGTRRTRPMLVPPALIVRYANDIVVGFQHKRDAERYLRDVRERLARFDLSLHPDKARLVEFRRFAKLNRRQRGAGKPETFDFLGFTHNCTTTRRGRFRLGRKPVEKRVNRTLARIDEVLRKRWHHDIW